MDPRTAYLLGVATAFGAMFFVWALFRLSAPWLTAQFAGVPVSLLQIVGMRVRKTDPLVVVGALVILKKLGEDVPVSEVEMAYLGKPEARREAGALVRAVRPALAARLEALAAGDAA